MRQHQICSNVHILFRVTLVISLLPGCFKHENSYQMKIFRESLQLVDKIRIIQTDIEFFHISFSNKFSMPQYSE